MESNFNIMYLSTVIKHGIPGFGTDYGVCVWVTPYFKNPTGIEIGL